MSLFRTPSAVEATGGVVGESVARSRNQQVRLGDQIKDLVEDQPKIDLLPTPAVAHVRNHDEPIDGYLQRRENYKAGLAKGMPGASLGMAVRLTEMGIDWQGEIDPALLPTITTQDAHNNGGASQYERKTLPLNAEVALLGTPRTSSANGSSAKEVATDAPKARLEDQVALPAMSWGRFEPAIRRWEEATGRPAPAPTLADGKEGQHRLNAAFAEWMMGLPSGWITDVDISRTEMLTACGNGVVPQQATLALQSLLVGWLGDE